MFLRQTAFLTLVVYVTVHGCEYPNMTCADGSCIKVFHICPGCDRVNAQSCEGGRCISVADACPGRCSPSQKKCDDGGCRYICMNRSPGCTNWDQRLCSDGSCKTKPDVCPGDCDWGQKRCPDDTCRSSCPGECSSDQTLCNGRCIALYESCSASRSHSATPFYALVVVPVAVIIIIVVCVIRCSRANSSHTATYVTPAQAAAGIGYSGARMQPVVVYPGANNQMATGFGGGMQVDGGMPMQTSYSHGYAPVPANDPSSSMPSAPPPSYDVVTKVAY